MKTVFFYICEADEINIGVGFLAGALKAIGVETSLIVWHVTPEGPKEALSNVLGLIEKERADLLLISMMSLHRPYIFSLLDSVRDYYHGPVLIGGYHPIAFPEDLLNHPAVDAVCIGDGEGPLIQFIEALSIKNRKYAYRIPGFMSKASTYFPHNWNGGHWYVNDLNRFPYIDYDLFDKLKPLRSRRNLFFGPNKQTLNVLPAITGRGCPYRCTYCSNAIRMSKFPSVKSYLRKYDPEKIVLHLKSAVRKYQINFIDFLDELFIYNTKWLNDFCQLYKKNINIPFSAQVHLQFITEEICEMLKDCGWMLAAFGIECGDEEFRQKHLNRKMSNQAIAKKVRLLKRYGIKTVSYNIMGMPFENVRTLKATLEFNLKLRPDLAMHFYWQPLPGTALTNKAMEAGLLDKNVSVKNFGSTLNLEGMDYKIVEEYYDKFASLEFSMYNGAPDRLMEMLRQDTLKWLGH